MTGLLIVISGPSGVGKGTLIQKLMKSMPELIFSVSATTRAPRENEKHGEHYFFLNRDEFEKRIRTNEFLEWAEVHEDLYGTPRRFIETKLAEGRDLLLDIDVQGGLSVKKAFPEGVFVFILPPNFKALRQRLAKRHTEKSEAVERRLEDALEELRHTNAYDYLVINAKLADAVQDLRAIIRAERLRTKRRLKEVQDALSPD